MAKIDNKVLSIIAIVGALILIVAALLTWVHASVSVLGSTETHDYSGLSLLTDNDFKDENGYQKYIPVIGLVLGVIAIILEAVALIKPQVAGKYCAIITAVVAIIAVILACLYMTWDIFGSESAIIASAEVKVGYGCYVAIVGAVIALIFSAYQSYICCKGCKTQ